MAADVFVVRRLVLECRQVKMVAVCQTAGSSSQIEGF